MFFNSIDFALFLPLVFILYWFVFEKRLQYRNLLLVTASSVFYGWWDWRFLSLILFSIIVDFFIAKQLDSSENQKKRRLLLWLSVFVNLGFLGFFKYFNFFVDNFSQAFSFFGVQVGSSSLDIVLPVGISFYTFQTLSYTIDVYRRKLSPTRDFLAFAAFVSFFPQLVAGPIERATNLLPQFYVKNPFNSKKAIDGMRQILWGLFKKIVIADGCAEYANMIFNSYDDYSGSTLVLGAIFFSFQIYGDFSGYSDIAIGTSRLFGFNLRQNFSYPYFSRNIAEFWRRWHISLSTWFRDYLYIPLGGSRGGTIKKIRNTFIIFIVSGFWHGANWTFIVWGGLNAIYFIPSLLTQNNRKYLDIASKDKKIISLNDLWKILVTFTLTAFAWIFFRAENMTHALAYISKIMSASIFEIPLFYGMTKALFLIALIILFLIVEWKGRRNLHALEKMVGWSNRFLRWFVYVIITMAIYFLGNFSEKIEFIYFQF